MSASFKMPADAIARIKMFVESQKRAPADQAADSADRSDSDGDESPDAKV